MAITQGVTFIDNPSAPHISEFESAVEISKFLGEKLAEAPLHPITKFTNWNEVVYYGIDYPPEGNLETPFTLDAFADDVLFRLAFSLDAFAQQPDRRSHAYRKHGNDALIATTLILNSLKSEDGINNLYAVLINKKTGGAPDAFTNLAIYGGIKDSEVVTYPVSYLEALRAKNSRQFPKETFLQKLNLRDLLMTCSYLALSTDSLFNADKANKKGLRSLVLKDGSAFSVNYDLPRLISRRVRELGLDWKDIKTAYDDACRLLSDDVPKGSNVKFIEESPGIRQMDLKYDGAEFEDIGDRFTRVGLAPELSSFTYAEVIRCPVVVFTSAMHLLRRSKFIPTHNLNRLSRELEQTLLFTNQITTAYMDTQVCYLASLPKGCDQETAVDMIHRGDGRTSRILFGVPASR